VLQNRGSWGLGGERALWFAGRGALVNRPGCTLKGARDSKTSIALVMFSTFAFFLALFTEVGRWLSVSPSPGLQQH